MSRSKIKRRKTLAEKYPPSQPCTCEICVSYCRRPGWWTVEEAVRAIDAGVANRMMLEMSPDQSFGVLSPAFKGCEVDFALQRYTGRGCTFLKDNRCELYGTGLQPWSVASASTIARAWDSAAMRISKSWHTCRACTGRQMEQADRFLGAAKMNILAIGAHPDDLDVCCGGTLALFRQAGERVVMCVVTDGRAHPIGDPEHVSALRKAEAQASAGQIGAELVWLGLPDGGMVDDMATRRKFIQLMLQVSPDLIITHSPEDYHSDHVVTSRLVMATVQMAWAPPPGMEGPPLRKQVPVAFMPPANGINYPRRLCRCDRGLGHQAVDGHAPPLAVPARTGLRSEPGEGAAGPIFTLPAHPDHGRILRPALLVPLCGAFRWWLADRLVRAAAALIRQAHRTGVRKVITCAG
jgi:hypothetical protein